MKELSIEDKAKLYDEAIDRAKSKIKNDKNHVLYEDDIIEIFPELKESEDERIKKDIIATLHLYFGEPLDDEAKEMIDWVEKQSQTFTKKDVDDAYIKGVFDTKQVLEKQGENANFQDKIQVDNQITRNYDNVPANLSQLKQTAEYVDEVKPQFHKGDWIVHHGTENIYQVVAIIDNQYQLKYGDNYTIQNCADVDRCTRLWDVTKDAKDGDVLVMQKTDVTYESIFIFNKIENNRIIQYLHYFITDTDEEVCEARSIDGFLGFVGTNVHPATKEQREVLFQKIKEAGYEWDAEKKEPKLIEQNHICSDKDKYTIECLIDYLETESDNSILNEDKEAFAEQIKLLKLIKDRVHSQNHWKPTYEQMKVLYKYAEQNNYDGSMLTTLYQDLKKLKEK